MFGKLGWPEASGVVILLGKEDDEGKMRLKPVAKGSGVGIVRALRKRAASIDLGFVSRFGRDGTALIECDARVVESAGKKLLEIDLPDFEMAAEEHREEDPPAPKQVTGFSIKPSAALPRNAPKPPAKPSAPIRVAPARPKRAPVEKFGVKVTFDPPAIWRESDNLDLTPRQADFMAALVTGFGGIMPYDRICDMADLPNDGVGRGMLGADFIALEDELKENVKLVLRVVPKMGYSLSKS